jgi:hypothetical protein
MSTTHCQAGLTTVPASTALHALCCHVLDTFNLRLSLMQGKVQEFQQQQQQQQSQGVQVDASSISSAVEEADSDDTCHAPKVFVPFITKPGDTPRKVQIQRCALTTKFRLLSSCKAFLAAAGRVLCPSSNPMP